jgi:uncharacterized damage-inducible protein DinB
MKVLQLCLLYILTNQTMGQPNTDSIVSEVIETWSVHTSMNQKLLSGISEEYLIDHSASGGRNVGEQFAHMHNVRVQWLSELLPGNKLSEISNNDALQKDLLIKKLNESSQIVSELILNALKSKENKSWPMSPVVFMGYLISHESHTRGQIILSLKQAGHPIGNDVAYGIWNWGQGN